VLSHLVKVETNEFVVGESVATVQTPQAFTSVPAEGPLGQQYRYFYGPVLKGRDAVGATPRRGTSVTFSRKALLGVGGFTYGSTTEDFLTSVTLHSRGYVHTVQAVRLNLA